MPKRSVAAGALRPVHQRESVSAPVHVPGASPAPEPLIRHDEPPVQRAPPAPRPAPTALVEPPKILTTRLPITAPASTSMPPSRGLQGAAPAALYAPTSSPPSAPVPAHAPQVAQKAPFPSQPQPPAAFTAVRTLPQGPPRAAPPLPATLPLVLPASPATQLSVPAHPPAAQSPPPMPVLPALPPPSQPLAQAALPAVQPAPPTGKLVATVQVPPAPVKAAAPVATPGQSEEDSSDGSEYSDDEEEEEEEEEGPEEDEVDQDVDVEPSAAVTTAAAEPVVDVQFPIAARPKTRPRPARRSRSPPSIKEEKSAERQSLPPAPPESYTNDESYKKRPREGSVNIVLVSDGARVVSDLQEDMQLCQLLQHFGGSKLGNLGIGNCVTAKTFDDHVKVGMSLKRPLLFFVKHADKTQKPEKRAKTQE